MIPLTNAVKQILIVNILLFVGANIVPALYEYLPLYYFETPQFQWWQMISHMFMHANLIHIFLNMFARSEEHTSELQSRENLVCRLLLEKKKKRISNYS